MNRINGNDRKKDIAVCRVKTAAGKLMVIAQIGHCLSTWSCAVIRKTGSPIDPKAVGNERGCPGNSAPPTTLRSNPHNQYQHSEVSLRGFLLQGL